MGSSNQGGFARKNAGALKSRKKKVSIDTLPRVWLPAQVGHAANLLRKVYINYVRAFLA